jgi:nucleoside-diphosphate-sugar epimerase
MRDHKEANAGNSVLLLGGAGYIGSALLPKLLARGYDVRVFDFFVYGADSLRPFVDHPGVSLISGDLRDEQLVRKAMKGVEAVVHLGGIVGDSACEVDRDLALSVNLHATGPIAMAAKTNGIRRFLFASTCALYESSDVPQSEDSPVRAATLYAGTKLASEQVLRQLTNTDFRPTILRFASLYGLSGRKRFDLAVNRLTAEAKVDGRITVHGGQQVRPFLHVDDAAKAIADVLMAPLQSVADQVFNIGSDEQNYSIRQVAEMVHAQLPDAELVVTALASEQISYRVGFHKLRTLVGFQPAWKVHEGIWQILEAIAGGYVSDYRQPLVSNIGFLRDSSLRDRSRGISPTSPVEGQPSLADAGASLRT